MSNANKKKYVATGTLIYGDPMADADPRTGKRPPPTRYAPGDSFDADADTAEIQALLASGAIQEAGEAAAEAEYRRTAPRKDEDDAAGNSGDTPAGNSDGGTTPPEVAAAQKSGKKK